jgi:type I restriction enzyme M protein
MIEDYFDIQKAKSGNLDNYVSGDIPFISNTVLNNGVARFVSTDEEDEIMPAPSIAVNGFGYATVQLQPFIGAGNGGVYVSVLVPKDEHMSVDELVYYAAQINIQSWRFSYGRRAIKSRLEGDIVLKKFDLSNSELASLKKELTDNITSTVGKLMGS